jgi:type II secretory pathway pseudopilin PulG
MNTSIPQVRRSWGGFTLVEMAMSMSIITIVTIGVFNVFVFFLRSYNATSLMSTAAGRASSGLERIVYGVGTNIGLREAGSTTVSVSYTNGWILTYTNLTDSAQKSFTYSTNKQMITDWAGKLICTNVISSTVTDYTSGCEITIAVAESGGGRTFTNKAATFVDFRN